MEFKVMQYEICENKDGDIEIVQGTGGVYEVDQFVVLTYDQLPLLLKHLQEMLVQHEAGSTTDE